MNFPQRNPATFPRAVETRSRAYTGRGRSVCAREYERPPLERATRDSIREIVLRGRNRVGGLRSSRGSARVHGREIMPVLSRQLRYRANLPARTSSTLANFVWLYRRGGDATFTPPGRSVPCILPRYHRFQTCFMCLCTVSSNSSG